LFTNQFIPGFSLFCPIKKCAVPSRVSFKGALASPGKLLAPLNFKMKVLQNASQRIYILKRISWHSMSFLSI